MGDESHPPSGMASIAHTTRGEHFYPAGNCVTPNCCSIPSWSELPQRSTILPSRNLATCTPRMLIFFPWAVFPSAAPGVCPSSCRRWPPTPHRPPSFPTQHPDPGMLPALPKKTCGSLPVLAPGPVRDHDPRSPPPPPPGTNQTCPYSQPLQTSPVRPNSPVSPSPYTSGNQMPQRHDLDDQFILVGKKAARSNYKRRQNALFTHS